MSQILKNRNKALETEKGRKNYHKKLNKELQYKMGRTKYFNIKKQN